MMGAGSRAGGRQCRSASAASVPEVHLFPSLDPAPGRGGEQPPTDHPTSATLPEKISVNASSLLPTPVPAGLRLVPKSSSAPAFSSSFPYVSL